MKICAICETLTVDNLIRIAWRRRLYRDPKVICTYCSLSYLFPMLLEISGRVLCEDAMRMRNTTTKPARKESLAQSP